MIIVDSSFFISLFLNTDRNYIQAAHVYTTSHGEKVTTEDILKETLTIISQRKGKRGSIDAYEKIVTDCMILPVSQERFQAGLTIFLNSKTPKDISLIDCITVGIYKEHTAKTLLTFDKHFRQFGINTLP